MWVRLPFCNRRAKPPRGDVELRDSLVSDWREVSHEIHCVLVLSTRRTNPRHCVESATEMSISSARTVLVGAKELIRHPSHVLTWL